jgi:hypothetical protein
MLRHGSIAGRVVGPKPASYICEPKFFEEVFILIHHAKIIADLSHLR